MNKQVTFFMPGRKSRMAVMLRNLSSAAIIILCKPEADSAFSSGVDIATAHAQQKWVGIKCSTRYTEL